ncbi:hypothetical protein PHMEG_0007101 [Phytophthora megakarya]|uniref:SWIM-type domain-containing protein n=1 Tax=Phytophthora megakarya TaxID=4795 RepID=A0A225WPK1_9STRA|nr:hypothetical protein PHMEG_0007101 [Phytophthora megakarya]
MWVNISQRVYFTTGNTTTNRVESNWNLVKSDIFKKVKAKCTCLFYPTHHLPCRHLMHVAQSGHGFNVLPALTINKRWCIQQAQALVKKIEIATEKLVSFVEMVHLRSPKVWLSDNDLANLAVVAVDTVQTKKEKQVVYIRLRCYEGANLTMMSSAEKHTYAKATMEPLPGHLSRLASADFIANYKHRKGLLNRDWRQRHGSDRPGSGPREKQGL